MLIARWEPKSRVALTLSPFHRLYLFPYLYHPVLRNPSFWVSQSTSWLPYLGSSVHHPTITFHLFPPYIYFPFYHLLLSYYLRLLAWSSFLSPYLRPRGSRTPFWQRLPSRLHQGLPPSLHWPILHHTPPIHHSSGIQRVSRPLNPDSKSRFAYNLVYKTNSFIGLPV